MKNWIFLIFCLSANGYLLAQENVYEDFHLWTQANLDTKFNKDWSSGIALNHRRDFNASRNKTNFAQFTLSYDWFKKSSVTLGYRLTHEDGAQEHRFILQGNYSYRLKPFDILYRVRAEHDVKSNRFEPLSRFRNKVTLRYKRKRYDWQPYISIETFNQEIRDQWALGKMRYKMGVNYEISKRQEIEVSYVIQQDHYVSNPNRDYIVTVSFTQKLNLKKKKKSSKKKKKSNKLLNSETP